MNISYTQILELWNLKILVYALRKTSWIRQTTAAPILVFLVAIVLSHFSNRIIIISLIACGVFFALSIFLKKRIDKAKKQCLRGEPAYQFVVFLFYVYDLLTLTMFVLFSFLMFTISSQDILLGGLILEWLKPLLVFTTITIIIFSPKILNSKSVSKAVDKGFSIYFPLILSVSNLIPGLFVFISATLSQSGKVQFLYSIIFLLSFVGGVLLLPYVVLGYCELVVLMLNRWPRVSKVGADFIFLD